MATIPFHILWPGGNTTAIVEEPVNRAHHAFVAREIMRIHPTIEQVGFFESPTLPGADIRLQMMGGEFCGNAARSTAYLWGNKHGKNEVKVEVSGFPEIVPVSLEENAATLHLPGSFFISLQKAEEGIVVDLDGIRHLVITEKFAQTVEVLIAKYSDNHAAVGAMITDLRDALIVIRPFVWVRDTNSLIPETGCGSGSIAVAIAENTLNASSTSPYRIMQPSGEVYEVSLESDATGIHTIHLHGKIENRGIEEIEVVIH